MSTAHALDRVENKYVCMINNKVFPKEQILIVVQDKRYYGCCDMCVSRLNNDASSRYGVDPVSGKPVDKATAIVGASADGQAYYFESESNLLKFSPGAQSNGQDKVAH
jgi:YHS domain-containing protein